MNYTKPEVAVLGEAVRVIENRISKYPKQVLESFKTLQAPAYDLDE